MLREFQIPMPVSLPRLNQASADRKNLAFYEQEAGSLLPAVDRYFAWYDRHQDLFTRGDGSAVSQRISA